MTFTDAVQLQLSNAIAEDKTQTWEETRWNNGTRRQNRNNRAGTTWTDEDHQRFLIGLEKFPSGPWKSIAGYVGTKTTRQTISHAQKYRRRIAQMEKDRKNNKNYNNEDDFNLMKELLTDDIMNLPTDTYPSLVEAPLLQPAVQPTPMNIEWALWGSLHHESEGSPLGIDEMDLATLESMFTPVCYSLNKHENLPALDGCEALCLEYLEPLIST